MHATQKRKTKEGSHETGGGGGGLSLKTLWYLAGVCMAACLTAETARRYFLIHNSVKKVHQRTPIRNGIAFNRDQEGEEGLEVIDDDNDRESQTGRGAHSAAATHQTSTDLVRSFYSNLSTEVSDVSSSSSSASSKKDSIKNFETQFVAQNILDAIGLVDKANIGAAEYQREQQEQKHTTQTKKSRNSKSNQIRVGLDRKEEALFRQRAQHEAQFQDFYLENENKQQQQQQASSSSSDETQAKANSGGLYPFDDFTDFRHGRLRASETHTLQDDSIFVSIASWRDDQCQKTIEDMYEKAARPEAIFVGAVESAIEAKELCTPPIFKTDGCQTRGFCPTDNIQIRKLKPEDARGPTYGRYLGMLMYGGQKYYMMIDSHNRFVTHWDAIVIRQYKDLPVAKGVLSHYPSGWWNEDDPHEKKTNEPLDERPTTSFLCFCHFITSLGYIKLDGSVVPTSRYSRPQPWAAAGFVFADARLMQEVPFDPYLTDIFDGEEILYSVRMWTHGWDIFSPGTNVLYHYYYRSGAPRSNMNRRPAEKGAATKRIQYWLKTHKRKAKNNAGDDHPLEVSDQDAHADPLILKEAQKYGLGTERSLEEWYAYAGVDAISGDVTNFCSRL